MEIVAVGDASSDWAAAAVGALTEAFAAAGDPDRAAGMRRYMRDQFEFFGVPTPDRRSIAQKVLAPLGPPSAGDLEVFAPLAWAVDGREVQYAAVDVLVRHVMLARPELLDVVAGLITTKSWWDTVDALASNVVGPLVRRSPPLVETLDEWIAGDQLWLARAAILHQLGFQADTDVDRLFRYALAWAQCPNFFARKAIGWALRQYARTDPDAVRRFLAEHEAVLSALTVREASKHL
jgi:3-methyladenine DNA glycosylase AlkD